MKKADGCCHHPHANTCCSGPKRAERCVRPIGWRTHSKRAVPVADSATDALALTRARPISYLRSGNIAANIAGAALSSPAPPPTRLAPPPAHSSRRRARRRRQNVFAPAQNSKHFANKSDLRAGGGAAAAVAVAVARREREIERSAPLVG